MENNHNRKRTFTLIRKEITINLFNDVTVDVFMHLNLHHILSQIKSDMKNGRPYRTPLVSGIQKSDIWAGVKGQDFKTTHFL